ncbi:hypothetical protein C9I57_18285 [Trinickia symbiotica]|uniref:Uncharacterized protein n=1 Tax=Trinickia symbiotica TaxID=863227 RepID=A0A2T3XSZ1_9BURK|nr:hypothetical protein [Trinickia symbiotica]PTB19621.1 hypothetical protein C9I57_18285 [Trinickia symbiotica]
MNVYTFDHPVKKELEDVIGLRGDMQTARDCIRLLIGPPASLGGARLLSRALYTQALVSYVRCFASGRRKWLRRELFADRPDLAARHEDLKAMRDKHVAHSAEYAEHVSVVVAAEHETAPAVGLSVRNWFFVGDGPDGLATFLELVEFVEAHLAEEEIRLGNEVATLVLGEGATWQSALQAFSEATSYHHPVYGMTKQLVRGEDDGIVC